jgi:hypothetical protein
MMEGMARDGIYDAKLLKPWQVVLDPKFGESRG